MAHGDAFSDTFIEGLRRDLARWTSEIAILEASDGASAYVQTSELRSWIESGEAIFARYERRRA